MIEISRENDCIMKLPANLDLPAAQELVATLNEKLAHAKHVWMDASKVESVSFPCVQVTLSAIKTGNVSVVDPSESFLSAFNDYGLAWDHQPIELPAKVEKRVDTNTSNTAPSEAGEAEQNSTADPAPDATSESSETSSAKRILTIDDSKTMRDMLKLTLANQGFDILQAVDGQDGLNVLAKENVDVVITDINMPVMDGFGVIENMRADSQYDGTPILVLTTESDQEKKDRARKLGATGFIVKPFNPVSLVDAIRKVSPGH